MHTFNPAPGLLELDPVSYKNKTNETKPVSVRTFDLLKQKHLSLLMVVHTFDASTQRQS